jgi:hypothetical protein
MLAPEVLLSQQFVRPYLVVKYPKIADVQKGSSPWEAGWHYASTWGLYIQLAKHQLLWQHVDRRLAEHNTVSTDG